MNQIQKYRFIIEDIENGHINLRVDEYIEMLSKADDMYHNGEESFMTDSEYDAIRNIVYNLDKTHPYFIGVGSDVRGGKVKLPFEMGSLDQIEIGDIEEWIRKNKLEDEEIVVTDKMDGASTLIVYDTNGKPQIAYSRGNGTEGADWSRHVFKISNVPPQITQKLVVRAEVELTNTAFEKLRTIVMSRSGKPYKNARNMVSGLMNSKTNPDIVYDYLTVVAYEIVGSTMSKLDMLETLETEGFMTVDYHTWYGEKITDELLAGYLNERRENLDYEIDGLVLDVESAEKRAEMNPTRDTLNPAYSIKYKVADASNVAIATVIGVLWNISKHGYLKPTIMIEPVELVGVTVRNCTGFNAKFIYDNGIGPGAKIQITRSGDVIPFCQKVIEKAIPQMPGMIPEQINWNWDWNETGVDAVLKEHNNEVMVQQLIDFFASIEAPHLKEGNIRAMVKYCDLNNTDDAIIDMLTTSKRLWNSVIGANGTKIYNGLQAKLASMPLHVLLGSVPHFGRGVGKRKWKKLISSLRIKTIDELPLLNKSQICSVEGFESKTAEKIIQGVGPFMKLYDSIIDVVIFQDLNENNTGVDLEGQKICMTGFRDKDMQTFIENSGGIVQSAASSKTTMVIAKDPNSSSGKIKKARELGIEILGIAEFKEKFMGEVQSSAPAPQRKANNNILEF